jgi:hypothetical protein
MRQAYREKEDSKKLKQKQRDRMSAKTGKMDIDYAVLHDAFFRHQTKPKLTPLGELYYEGKEFEAAVEGVGGKGRGRRSGGRGRGVGLAVCVAAVAVLERRPPGTPRKETEANSQA